jgi:hypothetical protein
VKKPSSERGLCKYAPFWCSSGDFVHHMIAISVARSPFLVKDGHVSQSKNLCVSRVMRLAVECTTWFVSERHLHWESAKVASEYMLRRASDCLIAC